MVRTLIVLTVTVALAAVCFAVSRPAEIPEVTVDPGILQFDGDRAFALVAQFVTSFPNRHSGAPANEQAAWWLVDRFLELDLDVELQSFSAVLYGQETRLHNVVAVRPGRSLESVVFIAHHDQARTTVQGADNNGSGVGIVLHLAEVLRNSAPDLTLVFISSDAEEYGMLGARHFVHIHPNPSSIIAALSLDNVGRMDAYGMHMAKVGQGRGYTDLRLVLLLQEIARMIDVPVPTASPPLFQALERAVSISFTDQGPFLTRGIPAVGLGVDTEYWPHYHNPGDTIDHISPDTLAMVGTLSEALVYELDRGSHDLQGPQPYLYRPESGRWTPPWAVLLGMTILLLPTAGFAFASGIIAPPGRRHVFTAVRLLFLTSLPGLVAWFTIRLLTRANMIVRFEFYPATPLDPVLYQPAVWPLLVVLATTLLTARAIAGPARRTARSVEPAHLRTVLLLALLTLAVAVWTANPFAVLFILPAAWLWPPLLWGSPGRRMLVLFLGGLTIYALLAFYGMLIQLGPYILWYLVLMLGTGMIAGYTAVAALVTLGVGIGLVLVPEQHVRKDG